ncbi:MAG: extracellular solute-binding protein [Anaerolineae bacterium]|nr:extracellular solute-binding protein [Anaerolineae bacterium]
MRSRMTRRELLRKAALIGSVGFLAACKPKVVEVTKVVEKVVEKVVKETVEVEKEKVVTKVVKQTVVVEAAKKKSEFKEVRIARCGWMEAELPFDQLAATYNALPERDRDKVRIVFDPAGKTPTDPVIAEMMASGEEIPWNAHNCQTPFLDLGRTLQLGTIQEWDPYFANSQYKEAAARITGPDFLDSARADCSYQGKIYALPLQADVDCLMYRKDYFEAVGQTEPPKTLDELFEVAKAVQGKFKKEGVFGFAPIPACTWRYIAALHQAFSPREKLFTKEGLMNILDEGWLAAMEWTKKVIDAGMAPAGWETAGGWSQIWNKGKLASEIMMHGEGCRGGMIFGYERLKMVPTPLGNPELKKPGTMFWTSCAALFKAAPYPQEVVDFYAWAMDPENAVTHKGIFKAGKLDPWKSPYEKHIDPENVTQNWALSLLPLFEAATPPPVTPWYITQHKAIVPEFVKFLKGKKSAKEAMEEAWKIIQEEIAKAK